CCTIEDLWLGEEITNLLDLSRTDAAAATDETSAADHPILDVFCPEGRWAYPGLLEGVPALAADGINHHRFASRPAGGLDETVRVGWVDAVDSHGDDLCHVPSECEGLLSRLPGAGLISSARDRKPAWLAAAVDLGQEGLDLC